MSPSERLSIQYVYELFYSLFSLLSRLAGAKVVIYFYQTSFFEIIFEFIPKSLDINKNSMNYTFSNKTYLVCGVQI